MNKLKLFFAITLVTAMPLLLEAQSPVVKWTAKKPFEQKVFIENKGQYEIENQVASKDILYGARQGGLQYYFTNNTIWIKRDMAVKRTVEEIEQLQSQPGEKGNDEKDDKELNYKMVAEYHQINFIGANPLAQITGNSEVNWYYNFTINRNVPVKVHAFKKLTYLNLYPGIDMEFYFPEDTTGFEYSFIVHPGADVSQIKMQYPLNEGIRLNNDNNIVVQSQFGSFADHAPVANQQGKAINCSFLLTNSIVGFSVYDYDKTQDLVIDPWTITPTFVGVNDAYDVDWDNAGNCYVYGGNAPWQLIKYDSSGNMLWSFTEDFTSVNPYYGGFAVDRSSGSAYLVEGFNFTSGAGVIKVNTSGAQVNMFSGNQDFREMWRIAFSRCTNHAVIAGGGTSSPSYQVCYLDTDITNLSPVNVLKTPNCCHDMWGITLDNYGNCYTATVTTLSDTGFENVILKLPLPALEPTTWIVSDGYKFQEAQSVQFADNTSTLFGLTNGYNGITISDTDIFTYDSYILKKWSSATGAAVKNATVNTAINNSVMYWGGLTSDDCDNIFLGSDSDIQQYNSNLTLVNTIKQNDTIFALNLGRNNILYASGAGFVSAIKITLPSCSVIDVSKNVVNANCTTSGSVTVMPSGGTPPYNIVWSTKPPQYGPTATNLPAGTYIATVTDNSCEGEATAYDTVVINSSGSALLLPSAFIPDRGGVNAVLLPNILCTGVTGYEFRVYDRWGKMVFGTTSPGEGWNGRYNNVGEQQPLDVYVYYIKFSCGTCNTFQKGNVTLIR